MKGFYSIDTLYFYNKIDEQHLKMHYLDTYIYKYYLIFFQEEKAYTMRFNNEVYNVVCSIVVYLIFNFMKQFCNA